MPRGGKREKAGRKTTWESGAKFEETSTLRVPNYIKSKLSEIAHRLDAGENIDFESNSESQLVQDLESRLAIVEAENNRLSQQIENCILDLETKSKESQLKIQELQQENHQLNNSININKFDYVPNSINFVNEVIEFVKDWQKQIYGLSPLNAATKLHQILRDLQKMAYNERAKFNLVNDSHIASNSSEKEKVSKSNSSSIEIVTKSVNHTQLGLLDLEPTFVRDDIKPLTAIELSRRFNKRDDFVTTKKHQFKNKVNEFLNLLKESDPQNIGWQYSKSDKKYHPVFKSSDSRTGSD